MEATIRNATMIYGDGVSEGWVVKVDDPRLAHVDFVWHGGAYIEYGSGGVIVDCWNVWDYERDVPTVDVGPMQFARYVVNRLSDEVEVDVVTKSVEQHLQSLRGGGLAD